MKIAIVLWDLNIRGGTQRQGLELARNLKMMGHLVDVFCYIYDKENCYADICSDLNIKAVHFSDKTTSKRHSPLFLKLQLCFELFIEIFRSTKEVRQLSSLIEKENIKNHYHVINLHDYKAYKVARNLKHKNMVWMMNDIADVAYSNTGILYKLLVLLQKFIAWLSLREIVKIIVLDKRNQMLCKSIYKKDTIVIRSGIDINKYIHEKKSFKKSIYQIFASSIFFPHRRFEDIVDTIEILKNRKITNIHLTINGLNTRSYDYYLFIKNRIKQKRLTKMITLINGMSENKLINTYRKSDIFVFSNHNQTWGLAVFEAMLSGCVCIVSKTSGAHEVLSDGKNALIVEPKSPETIADNIEMLINNPLVMEKISKNGIDFVIKNLSWEKYSKNMLKEFRNN